MKKKKTKLESLCFGDGFPAKHTTFEYDEERKIIRLTAESEWNESGIGTGPRRKVSTQIVYADRAKELATWFRKAAKKMDT